MPAGVQNGDDRVADSTFHGSLGQVAIGLRVADLCLDDASTEQVCDQFRCHGAPCAADQDACRFNTVALIGDVLLLHSRIDCYKFDAFLMDRVGFLPGPDRLGQQPFDAFSLDPRPPMDQR